MTTDITEIIFTELKCLLHHYKKRPKLAKGNSQEKYVRSPLFHVAEVVILKLADAYGREGECQLK